MRSFDGERSRAHVRDIRHADISALRQCFDTGARVLEIGGGNGYQASVVADWGCIVDSIDIREQASSEPVYHPVRTYDGSHIPYGDGTFDIVYSCAVLEHVRPLVALLREIRRVLKPGGRGIHIVPSAGWRFWTMAAHYPHLLRRALGVGSYGSGAPHNAVNAASSVTMRPVWRRILVPGAHGEYPSAVSELYYFSRRRWRRVFEQAGFDVVTVHGNHLFYTGYRLFPDLPATARRYLSFLLGSAGHVFVTRSSP